MKVRSHLFLSALEMGLLLFLLLLLSIEISRNFLNMSLFFQVRIQVLPNSLGLTLLVYRVLSSWRNSRKVLQSLNLHIWVFLVQEKLVDVGPMSSECFFNYYLQVFVRRPNRVN